MQNTPTAPKASYTCARIPIRMLIVCVLCFGSIGVLPLYGQERTIYTARPSDTHFTHQQNELEKWYQSINNNAEYPTPFFYRYQLVRDETIIQIAATFSLPYETIATLNHFYRNEVLLVGSEVIIPSAPGLYIHLNPVNDFEQLLYILRIETADNAASVDITVPVSGEEYNYRFIPGEVFTSIERSAFFSRLFHVPIRSGRISSLFGSREDPITGILGFHQGVDIAAPLSSTVRAAQEGQVSIVATDDPIYGNYIIVDHANEFRTLYAHLESITTTVGTPLTITSKIGTVGSSGHSTGPHIHFEIQLRGRALDPLNYMYIPRSYFIENAENFKEILP